MKSEVKELTFLSNTFFIFCVNLADDAGDEP